MDPRMMLFLSLLHSTASFHGSIKIRGCYFHSTFCCSLNRFLFDPSEIVDLLQDESTIPNKENVDLSATTMVIQLPKDDFRTQHAAKVLGLCNGDTIRAGLVRQELMTDSATIQWIPEGKVKQANPLGNGDPPGSLRILLQNLQSPPPEQDLKVSLLLALPRPLQLGRMLPMIAQIGVDHLILTGASKVPKDYFGSHLLRKQELITEKLIEGLCQAGDVRLPTVWIRKNLRDFIAQELDVLFPIHEYARVIAHPHRVESVNHDIENHDKCSSTRTRATSPNRMKDVVFPSGSSVKRLLLAVGPEGGWVEPDELDRFQELGFQQVTLGTRVLRSDVAVVSLLSLANEICQE